MSYREWRDKVFASPGYGWVFWNIIDANWTPEQQNKLAREWKEGTVT